MRAILIGPARDRDRVRWRLRDTRVIVVGEFETAAAARESGVEAEAFVMAPGPGDGDIADAADGVPVRRVGALDPPLARRRHAGSDVDAVEPLTPRERQVLALLADGLPNKTIADRLGISDQTVKFHVAQIIAKLGVANRTEAVRRAIRQGVVDL